MTYNTDTDVTADEITGTTFHRRVAARHARLTATRTAELRYATGAGPKALADIALKLEHLDGRLLELEWAYEQATGEALPEVA